MALSCKIENDEIVIRCSIDTLAIAWEMSPENEYDYDDGNPTPITNERAFAEEVVNELNREEEDGTTLVHRALDRAMYMAVENGAEGVNYERDGAV